MLLTNVNRCVNSEKKRGRNFVNGILMLSASTLICKIIGLFFKIPIIHIVGIEGMAFFSSAYNIYMLLNAVSAAGLPVALSIMISKSATQNNWRNVKKIFRVALLIFIIIGAVGSLVLYCCADLYSDAIGIPDAAAAVKTIAPTILFITLSGGLRGYFQGHEIMTPTAISQLIESLGKLILGVGLALWAIGKGAELPYVAAAAVSGLSLGVFLSVIYLWIRYIAFRHKQRKNEAETDMTTDSRRRIAGNLFWIALPITLSSCLTSITSLADTALITNGLVSSGFAENAAIALYSSYTNLAIPMFNLVPALVTPLAVSLIPTITASITRGDGREASKIYSSALRLCLAFSIPAAAGMAVFARPILDLIYPNEGEACAFAAPLLSWLAVAIVFSCLTTLLNAVLQSYMKPSLPIVSMAAGAAVKILLEYILVRTQAGISGAPISTVAGCFTIMFLNIIFVGKFTPHRIEFAPFFKALASTAVCISAAMAVYCLFVKAGHPFQYALISAIIFSAAVYIVAALKFGVVSAYEIGNLPFGSKAVHILRKFKLLK